MGGAKSLVASTLTGTVGGVGPMGLITAGSTAAAGAARGREPRTPVEAAESDNEPETLRSKTSPSSDDWIVFPLIDSFFLTSHDRNGENWRTSM